MSRAGWTGAVLAGGKSSRMGRDKALIPFEGRTLLQRAIDRLTPHVSEVLVIGDPDKLGPWPVPVVPDDEPGWGPLGGLITALRRASHEDLVVIACDMPALTDALIVRLQRAMSPDTDAVVPEHGGLMEPLAACYSERCLRVFEQCLVEGRLKMSEALGRVRTLRMPIQPGSLNWEADLFRNINTPGDL